MRKRRIDIFILMIMVGHLYSGCAIPTKHQDSQVITASITDAPIPTMDATATPEPTMTITDSPVLNDTDWIEHQITLIRKQRPRYQDYSVETFAFGDRYAVIFQPPEAVKDLMQYYCDIWIVSDGQCELYEEDTYVRYDSLESGIIDGNPYFRYDYSYGWGDSKTELLIQDKEGEIHSELLEGYLDEINGNLLTVYKPDYDMMVTLDDDMPSGRTSKPYYFQYKDFTVTSYPLSVLEEKGFLRYSNAQEIIDTINDTYKESNQKISLRFQSQETGFVYVNIRVETTSEYLFYYEIYQVTKENELAKISSGEGTYAWKIDNALTPSY